MKLETLCPQCGPDVIVDEDGCCVQCGCDAYGQGVDVVLAEMERLVAALEKYGEHTPLCSCSTDPVAKCDCGFNAALRGEGGK